MKNPPVHFVSWPSAVLSTFIVLLLSPTSTSSTPLNTNISLPGPLKTASHCTGALDWILPAFQPDDCTEAVQAFTYSDYLRYGSTRFEFHNRHTPQRTRPRLPPMQTPRRYTIGKCTVAIAMLENFWPLPGAPEGDYERTDVASFREFFESVRRISLSCVGSAQPCGWEPVGKDGSLGVFVFATHSPFDLFIELGQGASLFKGLGKGTLGGNGSTSQY